MPEHRSPWARVVAKRDNLDSPRCVDSKLALLAKSPEVSGSKNTVCLPSLKSLIFLKISYFERFVTFTLGVCPSVRRAAARTQNGEAAKFTRLHCKKNRHFPRNYFAFPHNIFPDLIFTYFAHGIVCGHEVTVDLLSFLNLHPVSCEVENLQTPSNPQSPAILEYEGINIMQLVYKRSISCRPITVERNGRAFRRGVRLLLDIGTYSYSLRSRDARRAGRSTAAVTKAALHQQCSVALALLAVRIAAQTTSGAAALAAPRRASPTPPLSNRRQRAALELRAQAIYIDTTISEF